MKILNVLLLVAVSAVAAENLIPFGDAEGNSHEWGKKVSVITEQPFAGKACFALTEPLALAKSPVIPIDPSKKYRLKGMLKSADGTKLSVACFGITMLDANKRPINKTQVQIVPGTETVLLQDAPKGIMELRVEDATKWEKRRSVRSQVAFNVKADTSDLPNFETTSLVSRIKRAEDGKGWIVLFDRPLPKAYPAGTTVRQHLYGASLDCCVAWRPVPAEWTAFSAEISGLAPVGAPANQFWKGTAYVYIYLLNDAQRKGATLLFDNITLEVIE